MITPEYCRKMARYNAWQNDFLRNGVAGLSDENLSRDRGAFFGSVRATLDHLLWADRMWLHRFAGTPRPPGGIAQSVALTPTVADWAKGRSRTDADIVVWADGTSAEGLVGDLTWMSGAAARKVRKPLQPLIVHFFNHQTHHRGQIHAMLTAAGVRPGDTDLFLMPD